MFFNVAPVLLIFFALGVIVVIVLRRLPEITAINTDTMLEAKSAEVKRQLLVKRLDRKVRDIFNYFWRSTADFRASAKGQAASLYERLSSLEEYYRRSSVKQADYVLGADAASENDGLGQLVREADKERDAGHTDEAERLYLEAIKRDVRRVDAYLGLGLMYRGQRQYKEAIESLTYAGKLRDDADIAAALGEVCLEAKRPIEALAALKNAGKAEPQNPRYLDRLLEAAILLGKKRLAQDTLFSLTSINPENPKLVEYKQRVYAISSRLKRLGK